MCWEHGSFDPRCLCLGSYEKFFYRWGFPHHFWRFYLSCSTTSCHPIYRCPFVSYALLLITDSIKNRFFVTCVAAFRPSHPFSCADWGFVLAGVSIHALMKRRSCYLDYNLPAQIVSPRQSSVPRSFVCSRLSCYVGQGNRGNSICIKLSKINFFQPSPTTFQPSPTTNWKEKSGRPIRVCPPPQQRCLTIWACHTGLWGF